MAKFKNVASLLLASTNLYAYTLTPLASQAQAAVAFEFVQQVCDISPLAPSGQTCPSVSGSWKFDATLEETMYPQDRTKSITELKFDAPILDFEIVIGSDRYTLADLVSPEIDALAIQLSGDGARFDYLGGFTPSGGTTPTYLLFDHTPDDPFDPIFHVNPSTVYQFNKLASNGGPFWAAVGSWERISTVPEPSTLALISISLVWLALTGSRKWPHAFLTGVRPLVNACRAPRAQDRGGRWAMGIGG